jgi:hypothetical protein
MLLEVCVKATYFQTDKFFQQKKGIATGSSVSPVVAIITERLALDSQLRGYGKIYSWLCLHGSEITGIL